MNVLIAVVGLSAILYTVIQLFMAVIGPARANRMKRAAAGFITFLALLLATPSFDNASEQDSSERMSPMEVAQAGKPDAPVESKAVIRQDHAFRMCFEAAKMAANHSSTVRRVGWHDKFATDPSTGRAQVTTAFSAKNSFGLETQHRIRCDFEGYRLADFYIHEL